jgi:hypothetical protein
MICREVALSQIRSVYSLQDSKGKHSLEVEKTERPAWTVAHSFFLLEPLGICILQIAVHGLLDLLASFPNWKMDITGEADKSELPHGKSDEAASGSDDMQF